jgi:hypothetical protein
MNFFVSLDELYESLVYKTNMRGGFRPICSNLCNMQFYFLNCTCAVTLESGINIGVCLFEGKKIKNDCNALIDVKMN